jgi:hypothetical protein
LASDRVARLLGSAAVWLERGQHSSTSRIRSAHRGPQSCDRNWRISMVMIGIDPHKRTHTAVAVDDDEAVLGE